METNTRKLGELLQNRQQWVVPVYQRHYEWSIEDDKQLDHLWMDLEDQIKIFINDRNRILPHYFGAVITSPDYIICTTPRNILVDGQQRITTFKLVLIALREVARKLGTEKQTLRIQSYLYNPKDGGMEEPEKEQYKLWPSYFDREYFKKIVNSEHQDLPKRFDGCFLKNGKIDQDKAPNLLLAYDFLYNKLLQYVEKYAEQNSSEENAQENIIENILHTFLNYFQVVSIQLGEGDDPQQIFSSLNGLSEPLSPADLIRNDIFHRAKQQGRDADALYDKKWRDELEQPFWTEKINLGKSKKPRIDHFIGHLVVAETAKITDTKRIGSEYKRHVNEKAYQSAEEEIDALLEHAETYKALTGDIDESNSLFRLKSVFDHWDISVFYPLVMAIKKREFDSATEGNFFQFIENYIVRRTLCGLTQQNYNNVISEFVRVIKDGPDQLKEFLERLYDPKKGNKAKFPLLNEVVEKCKTEKIYSPASKPKIRYILSRVEEKKRTSFQEPISIPEGLSIEHIMPQAWHEHWSLPSGEKAVNSEFSSEAHLSEKGTEEFDRRNRLINTIGNLTLVTQPLNSSLSNGSWDKKRGREGLGQSVLALNKELVEFSEWNEDKIVQRSEDFAKLVEKIWPSDVGLY